MKKQLVLFVFVSFVLILGGNGFAQTGNNKNVGIAINPVLALFEWGSGEINFWNIDRHSEINIPIQFVKNPYFLEDDVSSIQYISTGVNYRRFFSESQKGFYLQAGWRFDHASVTEDNESASGSANSLLFGFGYRVISKSGLFWGMGLSAGRMWGSINDTNGETVRGSGLTFDVDLFKFGFAW